jgi:phosphatidylglycerophosphate synthase
MREKSYYIINAITLYRLLVTPFLMFLVLTGRSQTFGIMLTISFFTDLIDGFLARKFKVTSVFGAKLDSVADDLTFLCAIVATFVFELDFIKENLWLVIIILTLYFSQMAVALIRYRKLSSFHSYLAKLATLFQGLFMIVLFLFGYPSYFLFYTAFGITILDLIEEIILVGMLPVWKANVKGIYWVLMERKNAKIGKEEHT